MMHYRSQESACQMHVLARHMMDRSRLTSSHHIQPMRAGSRTKLCHPELSPAMIETPTRTIWSPLYPQEHNEHSVKGSYLYTTLRNCKTKQKKNKERPSPPPRKASSNPNHQNESCRSRKVIKLCNWQYFHLNSSFQENLCLNFSLLMFEIRTFKWPWMDKRPKQKL